MIEEIKAFLAELRVGVDLIAGEEMGAIVGAQARDDGRESIIVVLLAVFTLASATLLLSTSVEGWILALLCIGIVIVFALVERHFAIKRRALKAQRAALERRIGKRIAVALAVVQTGEGFVLLTRVAREDSDYGAYDFEFQLLKRSAVFGVLEDLYEGVAAARVVVYLLVMQSESVATFKDGPAGVLTEEMANALGVKPVAVSCL